MLVFFLSVKVFYSGTVMSYLTSVWCGGGCGGGCVQTLRGNLEASLEVTTGSEGVIHTDLKVVNYIEDVYYVFIIILYRFQTCMMTSFF
jgi:hypothetical protein